MSTTTKVGTVSARSTRIAGAGGRDDAAPRGQATHVALDAYARRAAQGNSDGGPQRVAELKPPAPARRIPPTEQLTPEQLKVRDEIDRLQDELMKQIRNTR